MSIPKIGLFATSVTAAVFGIVMDEGGALLAGEVIPVDLVT